jgi:hypothetical protein
VVAEALSCLDKAPSPSDDKENIDKTHKPASCFARLDVDFLNPFREDDKLHLAENVFSGTDYISQPYLHPSCSTRTHCGIIPLHAWLPR